MASSFITIFIQAHICHKVSASRDLPSVESMAEETPQATKRYAIVTGGNKGIGCEICKQLASAGVTVVLTARDEKRGNEALESLKSSVPLSAHNLIFHQLDVLDPHSIATLVNFVKSHFGKVDILVNNAGIGGVMIDGDVLVLKEIIDGNFERAFGESEEEVKVTANGRLIETAEWGEQCLETNYYGAKRMVQAFIPLLELSNSPRIINVASFMGKLKLQSNEWAKGVLSNEEKLTEERVDDVIKKFLKDFKDGSVQEKGWPTHAPAYKLSKACLIAYTRILAKKYPTFCINAVCPGYVKTDMTANTGSLTVEEGAKSPVKLALMPHGGPSGLFFFREEVSTF